MPTFIFERITRHVTKSIPCRGCGRMLRRSTTLSQTINPFNKTANGVPKTREQIADELDDEAKGWHPPNDICRTCEIDAYKPLGGLS